MTTKERRELDKLIAAVKKAQGDLAVSLMLAPTNFGDNPRWFDNFSTKERRLVVEKLCRHVRRIDGQLWIVVSYPHQQRRVRGVMPSGRATLHPPSLQDPVVVTCYDLDAGRFLEFPINDIANAPMGRAVTQNDYLHGDIMSGDWAVEAEDIQMMLEDLGHS